MGSKSKQYIFQRDTPSEAGERRYATVMFADLARSTDLISELEIDDAQELLDQFLSDASDAIHQFGGTVARVQGDGILALFGAPIAIEDHVQRAALAALNICELCEASKAEKSPLAVRIGVHCGEFGLRWQNHDFGKSLDVVGATAHIAAKIQQRAPLNSVMVSDAVHRQLEQGFDFGEPQVDVLAGNELTIFQLHSDRYFTKNEHVGLRQDDFDDPIIGRNEYLKLIEEVITTKTDRTIMGLTGAPGIGKSRLLLEAEKLALSTHSHLLRLQGRSLDQAFPFGALANLRLWIQSEEGCGHTCNSLDLRQDMSTFSQEVDSWEALSPDARNEYASEYFVSKIQSINPDGALVVIVDDFHFLDSETKRLLSRFAPELRKNGGTMIIGTRPECQDEIDELAQVSCLLSPLSEESAHRFVRQLWVASGMEKRVLPNTIGQTIQQRAQGMPLALRHFSYHCIAQVKEGKDPLPSLPHQLDTIFRSQIDSLNDQLRTIFQTGCVLGYEFSAEELISLTRLDAEKVSDALSELCDAELLTSIDDGQFRFAHQLLQEAGYYGILRKPRQELHKQAYELLIGNQNTHRTSAQILGWHAARAALPAKALDHYAEAIREAIAQGAILTVDELYTQSKQLCEQLGKEGRNRKAIFLLYAFDALQQLGKQEWYREDVEDAVECFKQQGDEFRTALATCHLAITDWTGGRNLQSLRIAREGARLASETGHEPLIIYSQFTLGNIEYLCGEPRQGIDRLKSLVNRLGGVKKTARFGDMISVPGIMARTFSSWYLYDMGEVDLARRYCAEGKELAHIINQNYSHVLAELAEAYLLYRDEEFAQASALLEKVVRRCSEQAIYGLETIASARYVCSLVQEGRLDEADTILARHRTDGHLAPVQHSCAYYLWEGEARLLASRGYVEEAIGVLEMARAESERQNDPLHALHGRILSCEIRYEIGEPDDQFFNELATIQAEASVYGFLPIVARCSALQSGFAGSKESGDS